MDILLDVQNLETRFHTRDGVVHAVNGVSFQVGKGETIGIVGESGSGKSVTMLSLLRLIPMPPGEIKNGKVIFEGDDLIKISKKKLRQVRGGRIGFIFQDPMTSLNPVLTIENQIVEPLMIHLDINHKQASERSLELLKLVGIANPKKHLKSYPHEFSGGMRQRVMIAIALACNPSLLIADEPTTALDVTIQAQILRLVKSLQETLNMSIIWITHDLAVVAGLAERIVVMYGGCIAEIAPTETLYDKPEHPYTLGLLGSVPSRVKSMSEKRLVSIPGTPPVLYHKLTYCPFAPRCPYFVERCGKENPPLMQVGENHWAACWVNFRERKMRGN